MTESDRLPTTLTIVRPGTPLAPPRAATANVQGQMVRIVGQLGFSHGGYDFRSFAQRMPSASGNATRIVVESRQLPGTFLEFGTVFGYEAAIRVPAGVHDVELIHRRTSPRQDTVEFQGRLVVP